MDIFEPDAVNVVQIEPWIDGEELDELARVIGSTYLVEAEATREFERLTAELTGARFAIAVCNGTAALYVCLRALGIGPGDEVIVPNLTFIATANAVIMAGATPVLCEVDAGTFCLDAGRAARVLSANTRAIVPVHLYGQGANMDEILPFARAHGLRVLEDAAQGVGVLWRGRHVGTLGDMGVLSYYGNKTITCGEGGIILTDDAELAACAYRLKNHGRDRKGLFVHEHVGFNFSFTDLQGAVGISQMKKLPRILEKKRLIHDRYVAGLCGLPGLHAVQIDTRCTPAFWFTSVLTDGDCTELASKLRAGGIQTRRFFYPLHRQPCYAGFRQVRIPDPDFSVSESIYRSGLSLPSSYSLTDADQERVITQICDFYARRG